MENTIKVLITGADGVLGNNLVRELLKRNYEVSVLLIDKNTEAIGLLNLPVKRFYGNILDQKLLSDVIKGHEVVIHAAASTQVYPPRSKQINDINIEGTKNIINSCLQNKIQRLIHVGTANSFAPGNIKHPGNEKNEYTGLKYGLDYMDSKYEAQKLVLDAVREKQLGALIVNPTFMIGPYDTKPSSGALLLGLYHKKIPGYTTGSKNYIAVKDAAIAISNAITMGEIGECYVLGNHNLTYKEAFTIISDEIGVKCPKILLPSFIVKFYGRLNSFFGRLFNLNPSVTKELAQLSCEDHCYSGEKAREKLNMPCTELNIAVKESFDWFKENNYLSVTN